MILLFKDGVPFICIYLDHWITHGYLIKLHGAGTVLLRWDDFFPSYYCISLFFFSSRTFWRSANVSLIDLWNVSLSLGNPRRPFCSPPLL